VEEVAAAVEDHGFDARLLRIGGEQLADFGRLLGFRALERLLQLGVTGRRERLRLRVVDELGLDAMVGAEDDQARALG
jgi:hypothetical protein